MGTSEATKRRKLEK